MSQNQLKPIARRLSVVTQVHSALRQAILERRFQAGQRLVESELAEMLGVSRTPVREALSKLEVEGLVEPLLTGGVVVRDLAAELVEIYGLRQRIEGYAANLAASRILLEELAGLRHVCREALQALDNQSLARRAEFNTTFHRLLIEASHSPRLIRLGHDFRDYSVNERWLEFYDRETALEHHQQHHRIVDAIEAGDGDLAERLVHEHLQSALDVLQSSWQLVAPASDTGQSTAGS